MNSSISNNDDVFSLSVDPGLRVSGYAIWLGNTLQSAGLATDSKTLMGPMAWREMASALLLIVLNKRIDNLFIEIPQVYTASRSKGDPNDLIQIAGVAGAITSAIYSPMSTAYGVKPREWKGCVEKSVTENRVRKKLSNAELKTIKFPTAKSLHHNVFDAIGIGLYHLGR